MATAVTATVLTLPAGHAGAAAVSPAPYSSCSDVSQNLIQNCGFEAGNTNSWVNGVNDENDYFVRAGHTGSFDIALGNSTSGTDNSWSQTITGTSLGHTYDVGYWLNLPDPTTANHFDVTITDQGGTHTFDEQTDAAATGGWVYYQDSFLAGGGPATLSFHGYTLGAFVQSNLWYLDDVSLADSGAPVVTSTSLASSVNPSTATGPVRYTADITPDDATGTVTFYDGLTPVCTAEPVSDGTATCDITYATAGTHVMTAHYSGDGTAFVGSTSLPVIQVVDPQRTQTITVTSTPPSPASAGGSYAPAASSDSGLPVQVSIDASSSPSTCSYDGTKVQLTETGTCVVDFDQPGDAAYAPAQQVQQSFQVGAMSTAVSVAASAEPSVYGQAVTLTASTSAADGSHPAGTVSFAVDGNPVGSAVPVAADGTATSAQLPVLAPGHHSVTAGFHPTESRTYQSTLAVSGTTVDQAATTTVVGVHQTTLSATVSAVAPGSGTPTGTVTFTVDGNPVGTVPLHDGSASLTGTAAPTGRVGATYNGDADFDMSTASTARVNPTITATLSTAHPRTAYGWYRSPVTVRFTCTTHGAPLTAACPGPVTLHVNGTDLRVSRSIAASDGGTASIVVHVNLDQTRPIVAVAGVHNGATYTTPPTLHCAARDALSGLASCRIAHHTSGLTTYYTAVATDRAGNEATTSGRYTMQRMVVLGASFTKGAFNVKTVRTYTVVVYATSRPTYYDAAVYPKKPTPHDHVFHAAGPGRWTLGVTMLANLHTHPIWNIGAKVGATMYTVKIRIVG